MRKFSFGRRNGRGSGLDSHDVAVSSAIVAVTLIAAILIVALVDHQDPGGGPAGGGPVAVPSATDIPTPLRTSTPSTRTPTTTPSPTAMVTAQPSTPAPPATTSISPAPSLTTTPPATQPPPLRPAVTVINNSRIEGLAVQVEPLVSAKGFIVKEKGNYSGEVVFSHTTVLYENGQEGFAEELAEAMKGYDGDIKIKLNDGDRIKPNGTLVFVVTKNFKI